MPNEMTCLTDQSGVFQILCHGGKNTRVAPLNNKNASFLVPNESLRSTDQVNAPIIQETEVTATVIQKVQDTFEALEELVLTVAEGHSNGLFVAGPGGVGKTFTVLATLENAGLEEGKDYIKVCGYTTPAGLYQLLYENKDKLIVLDDCDSSFKDAVGVNILKAVLDTMPTRIVSWNTFTQDLPPKFRFTGQVIFISNLDPEKEKNPHFLAMMSRVFTIVIGGSRVEIGARMLQLLPEIARCHSLQTEDVEIMREFLKENLHTIKDLSLRWVVNLIGLYKHKRSKWKMLIKAIR